MTSLQPSKRTWSDSESTRKDVDAFARARVIKIVAWSLPPAVFMGLALSQLWGLLGALLGGLGILTGVTAFAWFTTEGAGTLSHTMLAPGTGLARPPVNSRAEALEARGDFRAAVDAWEVTALEHPEHPDPAVRVGRIHRDHLGDPESALVWFRRAIDRAGLQADVRVIMRELVGVARSVEPTGSAAAPLLARYRDAKGEETAEGAWASRELAAIKEAMAGEAGPG